MQDDEDKGDNSLPVRLLSLDGGHTGEMGSVSQLLTVKELINRLGHDLRQQRLRPCDLFDMIVGSGTGGLIAILLGRLEMSVEEAIQAYINLFPAVDFKAKGKASTEKDKTEQLEEDLETLLSLQGSGDPGEKLMSKESKKCKVFVSAMDAQNLSYPVLFRSYRIRSNASYNCSVNEAARATTAIPGEYSPAIIGDSIKQSYIAASHGYNNPTELLLREVKDIFPNRSVATIVNIGTGHPGVTEVSSSDALAEAVLRMSRDCERVSQDITARFAHTPDFYFRLNVEQGMQWRLLSGSKAISEVAAHTRAYLTKTETDQTVNNLVKSLHKPTSKIRVKDIGYSARPINSVRKLCPSPSVNFTGRSKELAQIRAYLDSKKGRRILVLYGLGGCGKTQLSAKFVEESQRLVQARFSEVFFVDGSAVETIEKEFEAIALEKKIGKSAAEALNWFTRQANNWLIVFDNVDDQSVDLSRFIPQCPYGNIIITTRNPELSKMTAMEGSIQLGDLEEDHAVELLLRAARYPSSDRFANEATAVVKELHCFALAITQAGAYIANSCSLEDYITVYRTHRNELLQTRHGRDPDMYHESVYTTWSLSVRKLSSVSRQLLQVCSFLHFSGIQRQIFQRAIENQPDDRISDPYKSARSFLQNFGDNTWDLPKFLLIAKEAQAFSLLHYDHLNDYYTIHPLVHTWCQTLSGNENSLRCMVTILALSIDHKTGQEDISFRISLVPHLDEFRVHAEVPADETAVRFQQVYYDVGRWKDCESLLRPVIESRRKELGEEHQDTLSSMHSLAEIFRKQGRWDEAEQLQVSVLETRKKVLGEEHPDTLTSMHNLASIFRKQGRWSKAEQLQVLVLEATQRVLGEDHPDTLTSMDNLAKIFRKQGHWNKAEQLQVSVLEASKRLLGEDHPDTLTSMSNFALSFHKQGRWEEAEQLQLSVLEARKMALGAEHPDTLTSMDNLASIFRKQGRWNEAEQLQVLVLEASKRLLGEEHPNTLTSMDNLGQTFQKQGHWKEAEQLQVLVLEARKRLLGEEHPGTLTSMYNLGVNLSRQGRIEEAKELLADVVEKRKKVLGEEHPLTLGSIRWLEHVNREQKDRNSSGEWEWV